MMSLTKSKDRVSKKVGFRRSKTMTSEQVETSLPRKEPYIVGCSRTVNAIGVGTRR